MLRTDKRTTKMEMTDVSLNIEHNVCIFISFLFISNVSN